MPFVITAVFLLAIVFVVFAVYARADEQGRRDRDRGRTAVTPPTTTP